jgi:hypothetical protein
VSRIVRGKHNGLDFTTFHRKQQPFFLLVSLTLPKRRTAKNLLTGFIGRLAMRINDPFGQTVIGWVLDVLLDVLLDEPGDLSVTLMMLDMRSTRIRTDSSRSGEGSSSTTFS